MFVLKTDCVKDFAAAKSTLIGRLKQFATCYWSPVSLRILKVSSKKTY